MIKLIQIFVKNFAHFFFFQFDKMVKISSHLSKHHELIDETSNFKRSSAKVAMEFHIKFHNIEEISTKEILTIFFLRLFPGIIHEHFFLFRKIFGLTTTSDNLFSPQH